MNASFDLLPVKDNVLKIYDAFAAICKRHGLRYWVAYGTLLGAIRHHGFIPWDDDLDIHMPREDYDFFFAVASKELPKCYRTVDFHNTEDYPFLFGKIMETRREILEKVECESGLKCPQGLYIDIFPLDGGAYTLGQKIIRKSGGLLLRLRTCYLFSSRPRWQSYLGYLIGAFLFPFFPKMKTKQDMLLRCEEMAKSIRFDHAKTCGPFQQGKFDLMRQLPSVIFSETKMIMFEGREVPVPQGYDLYLKMTYGDYMKLPPIEKRVPTHAQDSIASWRI